MLCLFAYGLRPRCSSSMSRSSPQLGIWPRFRYSSLPHVELPATTIGHPGCDPEHRSPARYRPFRQRHSASLARGGWSRNEPTYVWGGMYDASYFRDRATSTRRLALQVTSKADTAMLLQLARDFDGPLTWLLA